MNKKGPPTKRHRYPSTKHLDIETCNYLIRNKERWTTSNDDKNIVAVVEKDGKYMEDRRSKKRCIVMNSGESE